MHMALLCEMFFALCWTMPRAAVSLWAVLVFLAAACEGYIHARWTVRFLWKGSQLSSLHKKNMLFYTVSLWQSSPHNILKLSLNDLNMGEAPCLSVHVLLFAGAIKLSKMWPVKKWNIVQSRRIPLSWGRIGRESGVCTGCGLEAVWWWRRGETMMMDRHVGAPPVSKQQECRAGW